MEIFDGTIEFEQVFCFKCPECEFVSRVKDEVSEHLKKDHQIVIAEVVNANATIESSDFFLMAVMKNQMKLMIAKYFIMVLLALQFKKVLPVP